MLGGSLTRSGFTTTKSQPNLYRKQPAKPVNKKRLGTPIKVKTMLQPTEEDEDDELLKNLTREIEELRAKRLSHEIHKNAAEDDEDDDFETAIFAETLLGELGSSSGSHKDAEEVDDDEAILEGDSGASDGGGSR